jgi:hypothetical protein
MNRNRSDLPLAVAVVVVVGAGLGDVGGESEPLQPQKTRTSPKATTFEGVVIIRHLCFQSGDGITYCRPTQSGVQSPNKGARSWDSLR